METNYTHMHTRGYYSLITNYRTQQDDSEGYSKSVAVTVGMRHASFTTTSLDVKVNRTRQK